MKAITFLFIILFFMIFSLSLLGNPKFSKSISNLKYHISNNSSLGKAFDKDILIVRRSGGRTGTRSFSSRSSSRSSRYTPSYKYRPTKINTPEKYNSDNNYTTNTYNNKSNSNYRSNYDYYGGGTVRKKGIVNTKIIGIRIFDIIIFLILIMLVFFVVRMIRKNRKLMKDYEARMKNNE